MKDKADNSILIQFDFMIDLDVALFKLIKKKYNNKDIVNQDIININNEKEIISLMINRTCINPLELFIKGDTKDLYKDFMNNAELEKELLNEAMASDIFGLMITFMKEASSVDITVLCKNQLESDFIKNLNNSLNTIIVNDYKTIDLSKYTVLYLKYFSSIMSFGNVAGKHIYVANARYNMDKEYDNNLDTALSILYGDVNILHTIDLYRNVKIERK